MPRRGRERSPPPRPRAATPAKVITGRALVGGRLQPVEVGLDDQGTILRVGKDVHGSERLDLGDAILLPSALDLHVHTRDPGPGEVEDLPGATLQAAFGGVGTIGEMPNTDPLIDSVERVEEQTERVAGRASVDVVVFALARRGVPIGPVARVAGGFKLYMSPTTGIDQPPTELEIGSLLGDVGRSGLPLTVHAEAPELFRNPGDARRLSEWEESRPRQSETVAIERLVTLAPPELRLNVAHVTDGEAAHRLQRAGHCFEATPHHLLLAADGAADGRRKVNPPLRSEAARVRLLQLFDRGRVPLLASDHAPHSRDAKARPFREAPSGMPGVETMLPLMLERSRAGAIALPTLMAAAADRPARWVGLPRGRIAPGHRADLVVVDFRRRSTVQASTLHGYAEWSAFEGWPAVFPVHHLRAGEFLVRDGEYVGDHHGTAVRPEFAPDRRS